MLNLKGKPVNHAQELELLRRSATDKRALDKLVLANLGLVHKIVGKFPIKNASVTYEDLFQEGVAGLMHAISKFEPEKGYRLSTYSFNWILAYIRRYYQKHGKSVRVPIHVSDMQMRLNKQVEALQSELGRVPSLQEVEQVNPDAHHILSSIPRCVSLNAALDEDAELESLLGAEDEGFEAGIDVHILLQKLEKEVSARDYELLKMRYGIGYEQPHTLAECAEVYDITRARVHQVEHQCLNLMRRFE